MKRTRELETNPISAILLSGEQIEKTQRQIDRFWRLLEASRQELQTQRNETQQQTPSYTDDRVSLPMDFEELITSASTINSVFRTLAPKHPLFKECEHAFQMSQRISDLLEQLAKNDFNKTAALRPIELFLAFTSAAARREQAIPAVTTETLLNQFTDIMTPGMNAQATAERLSFHVLQGYNTIRRKLESLSHQTLLNRGKVTDDERRVILRNIQEISSLISQYEAVFRIYCQNQSNNLSASINSLLLFKYSDLSSSRLHHWSDHELITIWQKINSLYQNMKDITWLTKPLDELPVVPLDLSAQQETRFLLLRRAIEQCKQQAFIFINSPGVTQADAATQLVPLIREITKHTILFFDIPLTETGYDPALQLISLTKLISTMIDSGQPQLSTEQIVQLWTVLSRIETILDKYVPQPLKSW